jgi:hypothetical protein
VGLKYRGSGDVRGSDSAERLGGHSAIQVVLSAVRSQSVYGIDIDCSRWLGSPRTTWPNDQGQQHQASWELARTGGIAKQGEPWDRFGSNRAGGPAAIVIVVGGTAL